MIYTWKNTGYFDSNAQKVGERLEWLRNKHGGVLQPRQLVEDGRKVASSPLRQCFEWDNDVAAEEYRDIQARRILRFIAVNISRADEKPKFIRAFVNIVPDDGERAYASLFAVMSNAELRKRLLKRALHEADLWRARYDELDELSVVFEALDMAAAA